jgi:hypothetical protein
MNRIHVSGNTPVKTTSTPTRRPRRRWGLVTALALAALAVWTPDELRAGFGWVPSPADIAVRVRALAGR